MTTLHELGNERFNNVVARDFLNLILSERIGQGQFRSVYEYDPDPTCVIKMEDKYTSFSNVTEWQIWDKIKGTEFAKWFAPCVKISGTGVWLIQKKTIPLRAEELPKQVPAFFTDLKAENWGRIGKHVVCHDYGNNLLIEKGMTKLMRKPDWK